MSKFIFLCFLSTNVFAAMSAKEIMLKNEDVRRLGTINSKATLTTGGEGETKRVKEFTWWRKLQKDGTHFNTLTRFHVPAEIRNEGILFLEHEGDESDVLLYLPVYKKVRRVERSSQSGSFMGSELSYADIATPHVEDFGYKLLREEPCPSSGLKCWVIESTPLRDQTRERTGYSKSTQWVRQDNTMAEKVEHFDKDGALVKRIALSEIREVDPEKHKWMALKLAVTNVKNGKYTNMDFAKVKVNTDISDAVFTQQNLSKP